MAYLDNKNNPSKALILIGIILISLGVLLLTAMALLKPIFGIGLGSLSDLENPTVIAASKFIQLVFALGLFIIPPMIFVMLSSEKQLEYFKLNRSTSIILFLVLPILIIAAQPLINAMSIWNKMLVLPDFLSGLENWMKDSEAKAAKATKAFLIMNSTGELFYNIILIALIPAIGEELLFRGTIQKLLIDGTKNKHLGIWVAAILFSAVHMQFYGFIPRMMLGVLFGYLFVWTGSLWIPILGHFINNGSAVLLTYFIDKGVISKDIENIGSGNSGIIYVILGICLVSALTYFYYSKRETEIIISEV